MLGIPNLFDAGVAKDPYPAYAALRRGPDVDRDPATGRWIVHRYREVRAVLRNPESFSSVNASFEHTLLGADGELHARVRRALSGSFSPRGLETIQATIGPVVAEALDIMANRGGGEVIGDLAAMLPLRVMGGMLGLPVSQLAELAEWSDAIMTMGNPNVSRESRSTSAARTDECCDALLRHFSTFSAALAPMAACAFDADQSALTLQEVVDVGRLLVAAGTATTTNLIGSAVLRLVRHPDIALALRANPELVPAFIEEVLRYDSPVQRTSRKAVHESRVAGRLIPEGADILLLLGAANRDPEVFVEADMFQMSRQPNPHLGFGVGVHLCMGLWLARMEAISAIQSLVGRFSRVEIVGSLDDVTFQTHPAVFGPSRLEIAVHV